MGREPFFPAPFKRDQIVDEIDTPSTTNLLVVNDEMIQRLCT